jgi:O-antigen ligase
LRSALSSRAWPAAIAVVAGALYQSIYHQSPNWLTLIALSSLVLVSAVRPFLALLVLAGLGPLSTLIAIPLGAPPSVHLGVAMTFAFLTGAAINRVFTPEHAPDPRVDAVAFLVVLLAMASALVQAAVLVAEQPPLVAQHGWPVALVNDFLIHTDAFTAAMRFASGPLLLVLAAGACADTADAPSRVVRVMVFGASGAAAANVVRVLGVWLRTPDTGLLHALLNVRVNVQYGDLNAAGSYFAMLFVFTIGLLERRARWVALPLLLIGLGLWLAGSRTAFACVGLVILIGGLRRMRGRTVRQNGPILAMLVALAVLVAAVWQVYPHYRNDRPMRAIATRTAFATAGLKMAADYPIFGVGLGRFQERSPGYTPPLLGVTSGENAHNQFIQVLAELGVPGLVLIVALLAVPLAAAAAAVRDGAAPWTLAAAPATYLLTSLAGHPWLVPDAAYPFWIALALTATLVPRYRVPSPTRFTRWRIATAVVALCFAISVPWRIARAMATADTANTATGLSRWQRDPDNTRWRWAGGHATFFVDASARVMRLPLRLPADARSAAVSVSIDHQPANTVWLAPGDPWRVVAFVLVRRAGSFARIDVEVHDAATGALNTAEAADNRGALMIAQPIMSY